MIVIQVFSGVIEPMEYNCGVRLPLQTEILERFLSKRFAHDCRSTQVRGEYGYPKGSPNTYS
jgi:hypothetical protein